MLAEPRARALIARRATLVPPAPNLVRPVMLEELLAPGPTAPSVLEENIPMMEQVRALHAKREGIARLDLKSARNVAPEITRRRWWAHHLVLRAAVASTVTVVPANALTARVGDTTPAALALELPLVYDAPRAVPRAQKDRLLASLACLDAMLRPRVS